MDYKSRTGTPLEAAGQSGSNKRLLTGFTFAETMVSTLIFSILAIAILSVLIVGQKFWHSDVGNVELQQQARLAMDGMTREARESSPSDIIISNSGSRIDFSVPDASAAIAYYAENNQLIREYPAGTEKVLAVDVEAVDFSLSADTLTIQLDLGKTVYGADLNFSAQEQVNLRNQNADDDDDDDHDDDDDDDDEDDDEDDDDDDDDHGHGHDDDDDDDDEDDDDDDDDHGHDDDDDGHGH